MITPELLRKEYQNRTIREISRNYDVSPMTIWRKLQKYGIQTRKSSRFHKPTLDNLPLSIVGEYEHKTVYELGEKYGVNASSIQRKLKLLGVNMDYGSKHKFKDKKIELISQQTEQIILGSLMGDAHFEKRKDMRYPIFDETHSIKQKEYLLWKKEQISEISFTVKHSKILLRDKRRFPKIRIWSTQQPFLEQYYDLSFRDRLYLINALGLAVWYMDDGNFHKKRRIARIYTQGFSKTQNELIKEWFLKRWEIECRVYPVKGKTKTLYLIYIDRKNTIKFLDIVRPYIIQSMKYKLGDIYA